MVDLAETDMALVKATIEILDRALHARMPQTISVQLNPNELSLRKDVDFAEMGIPGLDAPILQFVKGSGETLEVELFCDTTKSGMRADVEDVRTFTEPIRELARVQPETHAPPRIRFRWGDGISFNGVVARIEQKFSLFSPRGVPLRATLRLFLMEYSQPGAMTPERPRATNSVPPEATGQLTDERYVPVIEVRTQNRCPTALLAADLLSVVASDRLDSGKSFELTINNWDDEQRDFKYSDTSSLAPGRRIEITIGYRGEKQRFRVGGTIGNVRQLLVGGRPPTLIVSGGSKRPRENKSATKRAGRPTVRLAHGDSLIEFERQLTLGARKSSRKTKRPSLERPDVLTATGVSIGIPDLRPDTNIELLGVGSGVSGMYYVTAVSHTLDSKGYRTRFECRQEND